MNTLPSVRLDALETLAAMSDLKNKLDRPVMAKTGIVKALTDLVAHGGATGRSAFDVMKNFVQHSPNVSVLQRSVEYA